MDIRRIDYLFLHHWRRWQCRRDGWNEYHGEIIPIICCTFSSYPSSILDNDSKKHATTTGIVTAGFGLSAFLFSTIAHHFFSGDTSSLLLFLAVGTCIPSAVGYVFLRRVPLHDESAEGSTILGDGDDASLLDGDSNPPAYGTSSPSPNNEVLQRATLSPISSTPNIRGMKHMTTVEFWGLYLVKALCMSSILHIKHPDANESDSERYRNHVYGHKPCCSGSHFLIHSLHSQI